MCVRENAKINIGYNATLECQKSQNICQIERQTKGQSRCQMEFQIDLLKRELLNTYQTESLELMSDKITGRLPECISDKVADKLSE